jgi:hypothetical protein
MAAIHRPLAVLMLVLSWTVVSEFALGGDSLSTGAATQSSTDVLTVTGTVRMPDGRPAKGAAVATTSQWGAARIIATTSDAGRFQLQGVFGEGIRLHVTSADGSYQQVIAVPASAARTTLLSPIHVTLAKAVLHEVSVLADGRAVKDADVIGWGSNFESHGVTDQDGKVQLRLPAGETLELLCAWHPELGVCGLRDRDERGLEGATQLALLPPGPYTIHVLDEKGRGIGGLELALNVCPENSNWIVTQKIERAHVRTDAQGTATVPWFPREKLKFVEVELMSADWKIDETDRDQIAKRITTVHVRRGKLVSGRLVMPAGASALGILVSGYGFGPGHQSDIPYTRARRDGSFTLRLFSEHGYLLGISDSEWASDLWTGMALGKDATKPADISIKVYPATPLTVRVTRGPERVPVANAWIDVSNTGQVKWQDSNGRAQSGTAGVFGWVNTDAEGIARAGVGRGKHELGLRSGSWRDGKNIDVTSTTPVEVEFHRGWLGKRKIAGRLMIGPAFYEPSSALVARAWAPESRQAPLPSQPTVYPNGGFEVAFDAENFVLLFIDPVNHRSGFATAGLGETTLRVAMEPAATYSGTVLDESGQPLVGRTMRFYIKKIMHEPCAAQQTDRSGDFRFTDLPANVPLNLAMEFQGDRPDYIISYGDRSFTPGEVRENDQVKVHRLNSPAPAPRPAVPLAASVEKICRDAGSSRMNTLVVMEGDDSTNVVEASKRLLDYDEVKSVLAFLPLRIGAAQLKADAATLARYRWPMPAAGEIVLVALKGNQEVIDSRRVSTAKIADAVAAGEDFLKTHKLPPHDARAMLSEARKEASRSGRRVWIIDSQSRCGPCFRLARWMDEHHAALDKDYVILKVMEGLDDHADDVVAALPIKDRGVPWHAITDPDGKILITCEGPLGNIGCPGTVEGIRHFRRMLEQTAQRLTPAEIDGLVNSFSPEK